MKKLIALIAAALLLQPAAAEVALSGSAKAPEELMSLWYRTPATNWVTQALPIGNGDMGAMIFGGVAQDRIHFNHKTLWKGSASDNDLGSYLSFGDLYITDRQAPASATDYRRMLDLRQALVSVDYLAGGDAFHREYFASHPDGVIAVRYQAPAGCTLELDLRLASAQGAAAAYSPDGATFSGTLGNGMRYRAALRVIADGASVSASPEGIAVSGAKDMTVLLACTTDFDPTAPTHMSGILPDIDSTLDAAAATGYDSLRSNHVADHSALMGRVDFNLPGADNSYPTDRTLKRTTSAGARALTDMLVFQYGRYLTIAASRGIAVPSNLQGIWNKDGDATSSAVWASDIHTNINVQMNYWPAEPTNLSECHMPLLEFIRNEASRTDGGWQRNAAKLGIGKGWVVNTASNIFGGSSAYKVGKYSVANAWLCDHLWQHYAYSLNREYLANFAWPLMKSACEFWLERLTEAQNGDGTLECPHEYSPEQGNVQNATAHSQQLVGMLFENSLKALDALETEPEFRARIEQVLTRLDRGLRVDSNGLLREWKYQENTPNIGADQNYFASDEGNVWQCHRHTSHLMALYPGFGIDPGTDPEIFNAAVASLADRGDVATGWARAWRIALWARARDAAHAYTTLRGFAHHTAALTYDWHGGLYDNMLDAHATSVFQIEGNYGATAGIAEMLLQSRPDSLVVLPALPRAWANGSISGLKAIGNFEADLQWADGRLSSMRIKSNAGAPLTLAYPGIHNAEVADAEADRSTPDRLTLTTKAGDEFTITLPSASLTAPSTPAPRISVADGKIRVSGTDSYSICDLAGRSFSCGGRLTPGFYVVSAPRLRPTIVAVR